MVIDFRSGHHCIGSCFIHGEGEKIKKVLIYALVISAVLMGCTTNQIPASIQLNMENIEYFGYKWENEEKIQSYCEDFDANNCTQSDCSEIELVKLVYLLQDIPQEYNHLVGCTAVDDSGFGLDGKSYIGISKIIPLTTTYREEHNYKICCKIDTKQIMSNELCFNQSRKSAQYRHWHDHK